MEDRKEIEQFVFANIFLLSNKLQTVGDAFVTPVSLKQWFLLLIINQFKESEPNINGIADFMGSTRQNTRKMLATLDRKGYVALTTNQQDKRNTNVALTEKTYALFAQIHEIGNQLLDELFQKFSDEQLIGLAESLTLLLEESKKLEAQNDSQKEQ